MIAEKDLMDSKSHEMRVILSDFTTHIKVNSENNSPIYEHWIVGIADSIEKLNTAFQKKMLIRKAQTSQIANEIHNHLISNGMAFINYGASNPMYVFIYKVF
jgi:hypothetical protein